MPNSAPASLLPEPVPFDAADFRSAMRHVPGAVSIVTTGQAPNRHGLTLTAGCSLSTAPPSVLVCVNRSAGAHDTILSSESFCWNILGVEHLGLARTFSGQDGSKGDIRFGDGLWCSLKTGAPSLIGAICSFDCRVVDAHSAGSHTIFTGQVVAQTTRAGSEPLVYVDGSFGAPRAL
ncbi:flavin reductase family protein [Rhodopseudomonas sp. B29]|uniref:flavin reductase family protein n=1 Tax=Rhodopseudomonas sp. B29 TaxID=95607 RepID=UPI00034638B2|nr:flavin reductase family protein [Rhodopseudomonas sp. B29]